MRTEMGNGGHIYKQLVAFASQCGSLRGLYGLPEVTDFTEENGCSPIPTGASSYLFDSAQERLVVTCGAVSLPQVLCP